MNLLMLAEFSSAAISKYTLDTSLLNTYVQIHTRHDTQQIAKDAVLKALNEWKRIHQLFDDTNPKSEIYRINVNAGFQPVNVANEVYDLIYRCQKMSVLTNGAFDITTAVLAKNYNMYSHRPGSQDTVLKALLQRKGYEKIELDGSLRTVFLKEKGMMISLKEISTGYILNRMAAIMKGMNVRSGMIQMDQQVIAWGMEEGSEPWVIGAPDPKKETDVIKLIKLRDMTMVSRKVVRHKREVSTSYRSLCIHPKTGLPPNQVKGVTIVCSDAEIADGIAGAVTILGVEQGMKLINLLEGVEGIIVDDEGNTHASKNIDSLFVPWTKF